MTAIGFADTKPEVANRDEFGMLIKENQETNRRIVIRVERDYELRRKK